MKSITKVCLCLLTGLTLATATTFAQTDATTTTNTAPAAPKMKSMRYGGMISSVDSGAESITFTSMKGVTQTVKVTSMTKIKKDHKTAMLSDAMAGMKISGAAHKDASGDMIATTVNLMMMKTNAPMTNAPAPQ